MSEFFKEQYEVSVDYRDENGYWVHNDIILVDVKVRHGVGEKNNHDQARKMAELLRPGCRINKVTYC